MNQRVVPYICKHNDDCSYCYINIVLNIRTHNCQSLLVSVKRKSLQLYIKDYKKHLNSQIINGIYKWFTLLILMTIIDNQRWPWSPKTSQSIRVVFSVFNASTRSAITSTAYWFFAYRYSQLWYIYIAIIATSLTSVRVNSWRQTEPATAWRRRKCRQSLIRVTAESATLTMNFNIRFYIYRYIVQNAKGTKRRPDEHTIFKMYVRTQLQTHSPIVYWLTRLWCM